MDILTHRGFRKVVIPMPNSLLTLTYLVLYCIDFPASSRIRMTRTSKTHRWTGYNSSQCALSPTWRVQIAASDTGEGGRAGDTHGSAGLVTLPPSLKLKTKTKTKESPMYLAIISQMTLRVGLARRKTSVNTEEFKGRLFDTLQDLRVYYRRSSGKRQGIGITYARR